MERKKMCKQILVLATLTLLVMADAVPFMMYGQESTTPTSYKTIIERAREEGITRDLTLDECIRMALENNLEIELVRYQPFLSQETLNAALGAYDFVMDSSIGYQRFESPNTNVVNAAFIGNEIVRDGYSFDVSFSKALSTGGSLTLSMSDNRTTSSFNTTDPVYASQIQANFVQPLWKNFRIDSTRRSIIQARRDLQISEIQFQDQVSETVRTVEDVYWGLVNAIEQQNIQLQSRELALVQLRDNQKRVEIGTLAPIEITRTKSEVAQAEQGVIAAESSIIQSMNRLKNLILKDSADTLWQQVLIPVDRPVITEQIPTEQEALEVASQRRPEIKNLQINLEKNDTDIEYYENQSKPQLDLEASYTTQGTAGPNFTDGVGPGGEIIPNPFQGGWGTVYEQVFKQNYPGVTVALNFRYYFGNNTAKANLASAKIQKDINITTMQQTLQGIRVEVVSAIYTLRTSQQNLESAIIARQFREEQLDGETKRFQAGLATNFEVLQAQRDLAQSRAAELSARIELKQAIVALQRYMFTNLDKYNIEF
ncbi:MAG: TolC family protein [Acidobacteria bacterium]|nr:TolC family protein [Acidobacteriota bacterium]